MESVRSNVCLTIAEGARLRCYMTGSDEANVDIGEVDHELTFDYATFKNLVTQACGVLAEMEAAADEEEAEWEAEQAKRIAGEQDTEQASETGRSER